MRLISVNTLEMREFFDDKIPEYVILSHTWKKGEISYQDWKAIAELPDLLKVCAELGAAAPDVYTLVQQRRVDRLKAQPGYQKIITFCQTVRSTFPKRQWA